MHNEIRVPCPDRSMPRLTLLTQKVCPVIAPLHRSWTDNLSDLTDLTKRSVRLSPFDPSRVAKRSVRLSPLSNTHMRCIVLMKGRLAPTQPQKVWPFVGSALPSCPTRDKGCSARLHAAAVADLIIGIQHDGLSGGQSAQHCCHGIVARA